MIERGNVFLSAFVALLVAAFPAWCDAPPSPYNPPMDIDVRPGFSLEKHTLTDREIPTLLLSKDGADPATRPVVIALHGGGMPEVLEAPGMTAKEAWFLPEEFHDAPYRLAEAGCLVVIFDGWWAGERFKPTYRDMVRENIFAAVVRGWVETARDVSLVLDALEEQQLGDTMRAGLCGRSGGAITALMAAGRDKRVKAVTSWAGCADMVAFFKTKAPAEMTGPLIERAPDTLALLQAFDPMHHPEKLPPAAILMLNNRTDPAVPVALAEAFHAALRPAYRNTPERLRLSIKETAEPTHKMAASDYQEGCTWLIAHLAPSVSTTQ